MRKARINQVVRDNSPFQNGVVTAVNASGSYDVKIKGRDYVFSSVNSMAEGSFQVGDNVTIAFYGGDSNKPDIIGFAGYRSSSTTARVIEI